jgi:hypothetical protein
MKRQVKAARHGADGERFGQARHTFEKEMAARQESEQQTVDELALTDDDASNLRVERIEPAAKVLHVLIEALEVRHGVVSGGGGVDRFSRSSAV